MCCQAASSTPSPKPDEEIPHQCQGSCRFRRRDNDHRRQVGAQECGQQDGIEQEFGKTLGKLEQPGAAKLVLGI
jgi:hypothetical protein